MKTEERVIKASFLTGLTEIIIGLFMMATGWHLWYWNNFHFFGVLGVGMMLYAFYHNLLYKKK